MNTLTQVRTRIAPSPTGKMHIGTARAALFNYLFAKHHGGTYCVRIEDTDKERSTPENIAFIKDALNWLNLPPDENYILQSNNIKAHKKAAQQLIEAELAYKDGGAVRFKIPVGETKWKDLIQGKIAYQNDQLEDFVILRSDGTPTYHLGVVVDDASMAITHVIRGDDHINNTPKQILLYLALGYTVPHFGHMPLIHGEDGKKLSKRNGAKSVQDYRNEGFLPAALSNYLLRLGWAKGDAEIISRKDAINIFKISDVNKGASNFDETKLKWVNNQYIKVLSGADLLPLTLPFYTEKVSEFAQNSLKIGLNDLKNKAKTLKELAQLSSFYLKSPPFSMDENTQNILKNGTEHLQKLTLILKNAQWNHDTLDTVLKSFIKEQNTSFKNIAMPLRVALTGVANGPSVVGILLALGKKTSITRLSL